MLAICPQMCSRVSIQLPRILKSIQNESVIIMVQNCIICGANLHQACVCSKCGFDLSTCAELHPTLSSRIAEKRSVSAIRSILFQRLIDEQTNSPAQSAAKSTEGYGDTNIHPETSMRMNANFGTNPARMRANTVNPMLEEAEYRHRTSGPANKAAEFASSTDASPVFLTQNNRQRPETTSGAKPHRGTVSFFALSLSAVLLVGCGYFAYLNFRERTNSADNSVEQTVGSTGVGNNSESNLSVSTTEAFDSTPKLFIEVCEPYQYTNCNSVKSGETFSMAGEKYTSGIVQNYSSDGQFISNLGGKYSELTFVTGHVDGTAMCDYSVEIFLDDMLDQSITVNATGMPQTITVAVEGVKQIMVSWKTLHSGYQDGCRIGFGTMFVTPNSDYKNAANPNADTGKQSFVEVCEPYEYSNCNSVKNGESFSMASEKYTNGIVQNDSSAGQFISNLGGKYSELTFVTGHVDGTAMCDYTVEIFLNGELYKTVTVKATGMPQTITLPIKGVQQIRVSWNASHSDCYQDGCRIGFGSMMIK